MRRGETDKNVHEVFVTVKVLHWLSSNDASKGVSYEVDSLVVVQGIQNVESYLLGYCLS